MKTDTEILDWLEDNPFVNIQFQPETNNINPLTKENVCIPAHWRQMWGKKDKTNHFQTFREAVVTLMERGNS